MSITCNATLVTEKFSCSENIIVYCLSSCKSRNSSNLAAIYKSIHGILSFLSSNFINFILNNFFPWIFFFRFAARFKKHCCEKHLFLRTLLIVCFYDPPTPFPPSLPVYFIKSKVVFQKAIF